MQYIGLFDFVLEVPFLVLPCFFVHEVTKEVECCLTEGKVGCGANGVHCLVLWLILTRATALWASVHRFFKILSSAKKVGTNSNLLLALVTFTREKNFSAQVHHLIRSSVSPIPSNNWALNVLFFCPKEL